MESQTTILNRHNFKKTFTNEFDNDQTAANLITPANGKTLKIVGVYVNTEAASGTLRLYFGDDENDQENTVAKIFANNVPCSGYIPLIMEGDLNAPLKITSTLGAGQNYFILVNYEEK